MRASDREVTGSHSTQAVMALAMGINKSFLDRLNTE